MGDKTSIVLEKISLRILEEIDIIKELDSFNRDKDDYSEGFINGLSKALQIVNGGKQDD